MSRVFRDIEKFGGHHKARRTTAIASLNVNSGFGYQAAALGLNDPADLLKLFAQIVISENSPRSAGVERKIARSDHCRCVSTPRWSRVSWNVVSMDQRWTNQPSIRAGVALRSVQRKACGSGSPQGARDKTPRRGE